MFKITELPEYIQSFLGHLIVKDDKEEQRTIGRQQQSGVAPRSGYFGHGY